MNTILFFIMILLSLFFSSIVTPGNPLFYQQLTKPDIAPPDWLFGIVWTIIYILIAISVTIIYHKYDFSRISIPFWIIFLINFIFNQSFTYIEFTLQNLTLGAIVTIIIFITATLLFLSSYRLNKLSAWLLVPYLLWAAYASYLAISIAILN